MGRKLHYKPGSYYQVDDRTGFPQRTDRMRKEWDNLIVDRRVWEPRQPQDLVRGVKDNQNVDNARPLAPHVFVGPTETTLAATVPVLGVTGTLASNFGVSSGNTLSIMLDSGSPFLVLVYLNPGVPNGVVFSVPLPYQASSGNVVYNYGNLLPAPPLGLLDDGGVLQLESGIGYPTNSTGLAPGAVWNNGLTVAVVPGITPNPSAAPIFFGTISAIELLVLGGGNLPTTAPAPDTLQLWNNGGLVCVA